jgi:hypothetical protein
MSEQNSLLAHRNSIDKNSEEKGELHGVFSQRHVAVLFSASSYAGEIIKFTSLIRCTPT